MIQPIILAAGKGTRMKSDIPKVLHKVRGKPMLGHVLDAIANLNENFLLEPIVVVGFGADKIRERYPALRYALQTELTGTATALEAALPMVSADAKYALVLYGDNPFISGTTLAAIVGEVVRHRPTLVNGVIEVPRFDGKYTPFAAFGRVVLDITGYPERIVESKSATADELALPMLNSGVCALELSWLKRTLRLIKPDKVSGERYLTQLMELANKDRCDIELVKMQPVEAFGVNSADDLVILEELLAPQ